MSAAEFLLEINALPLKIYLGDFAVLDRVVWYYVYNSSEI